MCSFLIILWAKLRFDAKRDKEQEEQKKREYDEFLAKRRERKLINYNSNNNQSDIYDVSDMD